MAGVTNMTIEIRVPALGESVTEATIGRWFKKAGDAVAADEPIVELETDKVTLEVNAPAAGVLAEIAAGDGDTVEVGALLGADRGRRRRAGQGRSQKRGGASAFSAAQGRAGAASIHAAASRAGAGHAAFAGRRQDRGGSRPRRRRH